MVHLEEATAIKNEKAMKATPMSLGIHQSDLSNGSNSRCTVFAQPIMPDGKRMPYKPTAKNVTQKSFHETVSGRKSELIAVMSVRTPRKMSIDRIYLVVA